MITDAADEREIGNKREAQHKDLIKLGKAADKNLNILFTGQSVVH